jgi:hypothetical protein
MRLKVFRFGSLVVGLLALSGLLWRGAETQAQRRSDSARPASAIGQTSLAASTMGNFFQPFPWLLDWRSAYGKEFKAASANYFESGWNVMQINAAGGKGRHWQRLRCRGF